MKVRGLGNDLSDRKVLLLHDGELADLRALVDQLGVQTVESRGSGDSDADFDVALVTPRRLRDLSRSSARPSAVRIAVLDRDARTLRALCRRTGVDLVVLRPVHPTAVRLLLLHTLYRGPDRRVRRVAVGVPVHFRCGFRWRSALLADLSTRGCQLVGCASRPPGKRLKVCLPDPAAPGRSFAVIGHVVRLVRGAEAGFAVEFSGVESRTREQLRAAVAAYAEGPSPCDRQTAAAAWRQFAPPATPADPPDTVPENHEEPPIATAATPDRTDGAQPEEAERDGAEAPRPAGSPDSAHAPASARLSNPAEDRRRDPRHCYRGRRVVALDEEAARVLVGHDLSLGGMRVAPNPALRVGQRLRVALYGSPGETPLVIDAGVARDDGERGLVLHFDGDDLGARRYLAKLLDALPVWDAGRESAPGLVVSEILDSREA